MNTKLRNRLVVAATGAALALSLASCSSAQAEGKGEKCYGVAKKGMNDCGNAKHACAAQATASGQRDEWIYVPHGVCSKIVNGTTKPPKE